MRTLVPSGTRPHRNPPIAAALAVSLAVALAAAASSCTGPAARPISVGPVEGTLPLGWGPLPEERTETALAPGVTLTTIVRGIVSDNDHWTLSVLAQDAGVSVSLFPSLEQAERAAAGLLDAGYRPVLRRERNPDYADLPAGTIGYSVRFGSYATRDAAGPDMDALNRMGYRSFPVFTGEDGDPTSGPWVVRILTIDPGIFDGVVGATHGASVAGRSTVTDLALQSGALAAVNAGFFVMSPSDGVPGEPAGLFVDRGRILSEATNGRIAMAMFNRNEPGDATRVRFQPLTTTMHLVIDGHRVRPVDGINRKPGVIRNCGGSGDFPTDLPMHDHTCTDPDELVVLTPEFSGATPAGDGVEAVVDSTGRVTGLRSRTGGGVPDGGLLVQGIGAEADWLAAHVPAGSSLRLETRVADARGETVTFDANDYAVNGGPGLVVNGRPDIRPVSDGLVHPQDPSFFLRWGVRRNPRTMAGVDNGDRILLVTVDGHQPGYSVGVSLAEGAELMIGLGAVAAMNLDGGGSTAMAVHGRLVGTPSDPSGERAVGDAIVVR